MPDDIWKVIEDEEKWAKAEARLESVKVNDDRDESRLKKTPKRKKVVEKEFLFYYYK